MIIICIMNYELYIDAYSSTEDEDEFELYKYYINYVNKIELKKS